MLFEVVGLLHIAGFEILTAVALKSAVFWVVTPCSSEENITPIFMVDD
jgi:hypothetical protein